MNNTNFSQIRGNPDFNLSNILNILEEVTDDGMPNSPYDLNPIECNYYEPHQLRNTTNNFKNPFSYFHINIQGLNSKLENFKSLLCDMQTTDFDIIALSEIFKITDDKHVSLPGYKFEYKSRPPPHDSRGGIGIYIRDNLSYNICDTLSVFIPNIIETLFIEIQNPQFSNKTEIVGVVYRPNTEPKADIDIFTSTMNNLMEQINNKNQTATIMGDMNINLLNFKNHNKTNLHLDNIFSNGFLPIIIKPTRLSRTAATLIDHIYINQLTGSFTTGILVTDLSDHFGQFYIVEKCKPKKLSVTPKEKRIYSDQNIITFKDLLQRFDFTPVLACNSPNEAYKNLIDPILEMHQIAFPLTKINHSPNKLKREPWMTPGLLISSRTKHKLFTKKIKKPTDANIKKCKDYNKLFNQIKRKAKKNFYYEKITAQTNNIKNTWIIIKDLMNSKTTHASLPDHFNIDGNIIKNKQEIVEEMNNFFSNIGKKLNNEVPNSPTSHHDYQSRPNPKSLYLAPTDPEEILKIVKNIKPKNSCDKDNISNKMLKIIIHAILIPITHIVNLSMSEGSVPDDLKIAKIIPIFKAGNPSYFNNYRPISLLPIISKILERVVYKRIIFFLETNNYLYKHQYGFRKGHSTIHPIMHLLDLLHTAREGRPSKISMGIFLDLSKAFDTISHTILLSKLTNIGIRGIPNIWIKDYLTNRKQYTAINDIYSSTTHISCGVPQGSILGPLLFLIYINDIQNIPIESKILSFADDTTAFVTEKTIESLYDKANNELQHIQDWLCANKLSLNVSKTKYIIFGARKNDNDNLYLKIQNKKLERISDKNPNKAIKFLGIYIDETLSWRQHISHVNKKISHSIFGINRIKNFLPHKSLKILYHTLVVPHISYNLVIWGRPSNPAINKTVLLQKRALRAINKANYNAHTDPLFKNNKILKVKDLFVFEALRFLTKLENNKLPISFQGFFPLNRDIHIHRITRQSDQFFIKASRYSITKALPCNTLPKIWNDWKSKNIVKDHLNTKFLKNVKTKLLDEYNDIIKCNNRYCRECHNN